MMTHMHELTLSCEQFETVQLCILGTVVAMHHAADRSIDEPEGEALRDGAAELLTLTQNLRDWAQVIPAR
jgi:hypothetical protein